jgi:hypothetical protein
MTNISKRNNIFNDWADFWFYEIGANIISANTQDKRTYEIWSENQNNPIPIEVHESRKKLGYYNKGIAVLLGKLWRGQFEDKYLIGIDCDNQKSIEEICTKNGKTITLEELANWTIVEQHKDNLNKAHIYILSTKPFKNKDRDPKKTQAESLNEIPEIEIKCEKRIMFCSPSIQENGYPYEILGTKEPALCDEFELHLDNIFRKHGIEYIQQPFQTEYNTTNSLPEPLRKLINWLVIPKDFQFRINEGIRHVTLLSFANCLLIKYKYDNNISKEDLKDFFIQVNNQLCHPIPLPENEIETIWRDAISFSTKVMQDFKVINNNKKDEENYNKPILISLQIGEELLKEDIVQSFVKDSQQNNLILEFNHKYPYTKIHVPTTRPNKWLDFRKSFKKILEEYEIKEEHIKLILKALDSNHDLIVNKSGEGGDSGDSGIVGTAADTLVKLALENSILFKDEFNIPYALVKINDHFEVMSIKGNNFESYLSKLYYDSNDKKTANAESINNSKRTLFSIALFEGQTIPLYLRIAWGNPETKDSIYYDLTDEKRRCVKIIKGEGWKIVENQIEVLFKRYGHHLPQLEPTHNYDNKILDKFIDSLNISNENDKILVKVWIISLLIPEIPIPMLLPFGAEGSAKSTLQRKIKLLVDPSSLKLLSIYNDKTQFIQQLSHNYLCFYDNVRYEPPWLSDETCRAITGGAFTKRELFTNDEDIPYTYKKRMSFSGINIIFKEADALDRSIRIELERLDPKKKITEDRIDEELKQQIPQLLGYIFDVVAKALDLKDSVSLKELPRMADFAVWGEAIARALGYKPLEFLNAYFENIGKQKIEIIESDPFTESISKFIDYDIQSWISQLPIFIQNLKKYSDDNNIDNSKFPKNAQSISNRLRKAKTPLLEGLGIEIIVDRITSGIGNNKKLKNTAIVKIRKRSPLPPPPPPNQNDEGNGGDSGGDPLDSSGDQTSIETKTSPPESSQIPSQNDSDLSKSGDSGDSGDVFRKISFACHYCSYKGKSESELLNHSVNTHPGRPARPDESILKLYGNHDLGGSINNSDERSLEKN